MKVSETPTYPFVEAAHYLNLPLSALRAWCLGQPMCSDTKARRFQLIDKLADRPECEVYKQRLQEAGKASPYAATTQRALVTAYQDAGKAGCGKPD